MPCSHPALRQVSRQRAYSRLRFVLPSGGSSRFRPRTPNLTVYHPGMTSDSALTAFILAGGKSTRMGTDKAFAILDGRALLARALDVARSVTPNVCIVGEPLKFAPFATVVQDQFPGCGPLAGIHAALRSSQTDLNLILAVDLPFVSPAFLQFLITRAERSPVSTAIVPRAGERWQPLCALYRRPFAGLADQSLRAGRYKIDSLFSETDVLAIEDSELQAAGFSSRIFHNVNTPEELATAHE
jgi:molybdopterin-guanine dinucleotide biosynthesis protein A